MISIRMYYHLYAHTCACACVRFNSIVIVMILVTFIVSIPDLAYAVKGVVIGHEVPLFKEQNINAHILQYVRKSDIIFIHDRHLTQNYSNFFETMDKNGQKAYILKEYVKLITHDAREDLNTPFLNYDPTDYRLEEPIRRNYPFFNPNRYRSGAVVTSGPAHRTHYPYPRQIIKENYRSQLGLNLFYIRNIAEDLTSKFYVGFDIQIENHRSNFQFLGPSHVSAEYGNILSLGPRISYDAFRDKHQLLTIYANWLFQYHHIKIIQEENLSNNEVNANISGEISDHAIYKAYGMTSVVGTTYQREIAPQLFLMAGSSIFLRLPSTLKTQDIPQYEHLWNDETSTYYRPLHLGFNLLFGVQYIH